MPTFKHFLRRPFLLLLAVALFALGFISINRILWVRAEMQRQVSIDLEEQIADRVAGWEQRLNDQLGQWLDTASVDPVQAARVQSALAKRQPWFDSLYLWIPERQVRVGPETVQLPGTFLFPRMAPREDTESLTANPCLRAAHAIRMVPTINPVAAATAYVDGCSGEAVAVRLMASTEAATLLARAGRYDDALTALGASGLSPELPVARAIEQGLAPFRVVVNRTHRGQLLMELGREQEALDLYYETGVEVAELDAPMLEDVLTYVRWPVIAELRAHGRIQDAQRMELLLARAERRLAAWREIRDRILTRPTGPSARLIHDQYARTPFLLFYGPVRDGEMGAAIALDQPSLIADFLSSMRRYHRYLTVLDDSGEHVAGVRGGGDVVAVVPFTRSLNHLTVGIRASALESQLARLPNQWLVPIIVVLFVVILGTLSILAQARASVNQELMLKRQRAFTTRVTHELKTPLAGIRVMAENLEDGIWRDEAHREEMARRIVEESDKLTRRIDEVLAVARERSVPNPEPFDPEEVMLLNIEDWGPRMQQAGIQLSAELDATDEVMGHMEAVRDAVACLLDNAIKYSDEAKDPRLVQIVLRQDGEWIVFEVADNGLGVPKGMRKSIFDQFVRVEGPNRGKAGGHGLGLDQVSKIVRAHSGTVECTDGIDGGARFVIRLPAKK